MMYNCKASDIILWCDGREAQQKRKKKTDGSSTNRKKRLIKCSKH